MGLKMRARLYDFAFFSALRCVSISEEAKSVFRYMAFDIGAIEILALLGRSIHT